MHGECDRPWRRVTSRGQIAAVLCLAAGLAAGTSSALMISARAAGGQPKRGAGSAQSLPPPRFGHTLDVGLVSGTVIITPPHRRAFTLGVQDRNIPIDSLIDTTHGRIDLRAAPAPKITPKQARVEDAQFYDGAFTVRQPPGAQVTGVRLSGGKFTACSAASGAVDRARAASAHTASLPHTVVRLLWASGSGRFRTRGRYAAATVRGTVWLTKDYCDGTLVRVRRGVVSVDDLVRRMTVTLVAGQRYFARAP
jgi:hypothetical protein